MTINVDNLVVKQQHRPGGSDVYNFEDCVVTASERSGVQMDPNDIESGEAEELPNEMTARSQNALPCFAGGPHNSLCVVCWLCSAMPFPLGDLSVVFW